MFKSLAEIEIEMTDLRTELQKTQRKLEKSERKRMKLEKDLDAALKSQQQANSSNAQTLALLNQKLKKDTQGAVNISRGSSARDIFGKNQQLMVPGNNGN